MPVPPTFATTPDAAVGLACPYCQTPMAAADQAAVCGDCGTTHHGECWGENLGCAVPGCESGPDPLAMQAAGGASEAAGAGSITATANRLSIPVEETPRRGLGRRPTPAAVTLGSGPPPRRRSKGPLVAGVVSFALIAGTIGVLLTSGAEPPREVTSTRCQTAPGSCTNRAVGGTPHALTERDVIEQTQALVRAYYGALAEDTDDGRARARAMLSRGERARLDADDAAAQEWETQARRIALALRDPNAAQVTRLITGLDSSKRRGIARVNVVGMRWDGQGCRSQGKFEGVTWAEHDGPPETGAWWLDPNPRDRKLASGTEPLGASCLAETP